MRRVPHERGRGRSGKRKDVHERALGLLAVRQRSRRELERRLEGAGFDPEDVQAEVDRLQQVGLIDDQAFARAAVEHSFTGRKEGRRVAAGRLMRAGVAPETAETVLDEAAGDEEERANALAAAKAARLTGLQPDAAFRRLSGMLARRGYAPDLARRAARRALAVETFED
jgi:regulatory protein